MSAPTAQSTFKRGASGDSASSEWTVILQEPAVRSTSFDGGMDSRLCQTFGCVIAEKHRVHPVEPGRSNVAQHSESNGDDCAVVGSV